MVDGVIDLEQGILVVDVVALRAHIVHLVYGRARDTGEGDFDKVVTSKERGDEIPSLELEEDVRSRVFLFGGVGTVVRFEELLKVFACG